MLQGCQDGVTMSDICHNKALSFRIPCHPLSDHWQKPADLRMHALRIAHDLTFWMESAAQLCYEVFQELPNTSWGVNLPRFLFIAFSPLHSHFTWSQYYLRGWGEQPQESELVLKCSKEPNLLVVVEEGQGGWEAGGGKAIYAFLLSLNRKHSSYLILSPTEALVESRWTKSPNWPIERTSHVKVTGSLACGSCGSQQVCVQCM